MSQSQSTPNLTDLRANLARTEEDFRIARKHATEAGERPYSAENHHAYVGAEKWADICRERMESARGALIRALADDAARTARDNRERGHDEDATFGTGRHAGYLGVWHALGYAPKNEEQS